MNWSRRRGKALGERDGPGQVTRDAIVVAYEEAPHAPDRVGNRQRWGCRRENRDDRHSASAQYCHPGRYAACKAAIPTEPSSREQKLEERPLPAGMLNRPHQLGTRKPTEYAKHRGVRGLRR